MRQLIIFIIGLLGLLFFSYKDYKHLSIKNNHLLLFLVSSIIILCWTNNLFILFYCLAWFLLSLIWWFTGCMGGADAKILLILPIYTINLTPNALAGQLIFLGLLGIVGTLYFIVSKLILKNYKEIPFIPIITLSYILNYIFWII